MKEKKRTRLTQAAMIRVRSRCNIFYMLLMLLCFVLYGDDPFERIQISDANLRHQTEYELRSKLIQLRSLYIPASASHTYY